jgi:hypothetical protein
VLVAYFTYFAPESRRRIVQFLQAQREEVFRHRQPAGPAVRVVRRHPARRPSPNQTPINRGEHREDHRD